MTLDERKKKILESVIKDYVETAEPVGSRAVVKKHNLKISAATVRNEMSDLEEMGYLAQPHTSSGRIPSEIGFRYYVDCMMKKEALCDGEIELLYKIVNENLQEWNKVIQSIGNFLSQITNYASFIVVPSVKSSDFKFLQVVPIESGKAMVLLVTDMGVIMHRKIEVPDSILPEDLQLIGKMLNQTFQGKKLGQINRTDLQYIRDDLRKRRQVIDKALDAVDGLLENSNDEKVIINGALNILNEPEFKDLDKLKRILTILEEDMLLKNVIPETESDDVDITIGKENKFDDIKEMSIVIAGYKSFGEMGRIGLIGPVRMEYWKAAGTVESVRSIIEELFRMRS